MPQIVSVFMLIKGQKNAINTTFFFYYNYAINVIKIYRREGWVVCVLGGVGINYQYILRKNI